MDEPTRALSATTIARLLVDTSPYLSCDDCFDLLDAYVERQVVNPQYVDAAMAAHLAGCGACAEEAETLRELVAASSGDR